MGIVWVCKWFGPAVTYLGRITEQPREGRLEVALDVLPVDCSAVKQCNGTIIKMVEEFRAMALVTDAALETVQQVQQAQDGIRTRWRYVYTPGPSLSSYLIS